MIELRLDIEPLPMPRPRSGQSGRGQGSHTFIPTAIRHYQEELRWAMAGAMRKAKVRQPLEDPVELRLHFQRSTRRRVDLDNLVKAVQDAANGLLFEDDSQIVRLEAEKTVGAEGFVELLVKPRRAA